MREAADWADQQVALVRDDPAGRLALMARVQNDFRESRPPRSAKLLAPM